MTSLNSLFIRDTAMFAILNAYTYVDNFCVKKLCVFFFLLHFSMVYGCDVLLLVLMFRLIVGNSLYCSGS